MLGGMSQTAVAGPVLDRIRQSGKITLAYRESAIPFSYLDADKRPIGYTMDLCMRISDAVRKQLGLKSLSTEYVKVTEFNQVKMIEEDKVDLECGTTSNNADAGKRSCSPYRITSPEPGSWCARTAPLST